MAPKQVNPVKLIEKGKAPTPEGTPLMIAELLAQTPLTPGGKPVKVAPVAPWASYTMGMMA